MERLKKTAKFTSCGGVEILYGLNLLQNGLVLVEAEIQDRDVQFMWHLQH